jgi:hypothetical protein
MKLSTRSLEIALGAVEHTVVGVLGAGPPDWRELLEEVTAAAELEAAIEERKQTKGEA